VSQTRQYPATEPQKPKTPSKNKPLNLKPNPTPCTPSQITPNSSLPQTHLKAVPPSSACAPQLLAAPVLLPALPLASSAPLEPALLTLICGSRCSSVRVHPASVYKPGMWVLGPAGRSAQWRHQRYTAIQDQHCEIGISPIEAHAGCLTYRPWPALKFGHVDVP